MAVRATMAPLIGRVRELIADPAGAGQAFSNQAVQDALDRQKLVVRYGQLSFHRSSAALTGQYLEYFSEYTDWEDGATLTDFGLHAITASSADLLTGYWTLATNTYPPVYVSGQTYDVYRAAIELLRMWGGRDPVVAAGKAMLVKVYQPMVRTKTIMLTRTDVNTCAYPDGELPLPPNARRG